MKEEQNNSHKDKICVEDESTLFNKFGPHCLLFSSTPTVQLFIFLLFLKNDDLHIFEVNFKLFSFPAKLFQSPKRNLIDFWRSVTSFVCVNRWWACGLCRTVCDGLSALCAVLVLLPWTRLPQSFCDPSVRDWESGRVRFTGSAAESNLENGRGYHSHTPNDLAHLPRRHGAPTRIVWGLAQTPAAAATMFCASPVTRFLPFCWFTGVGRMGIANMWNYAFQTTTMGIISLLWSHAGFESINTYILN